MKHRNYKKLLILNAPYPVLALFATKLGQAWRLSPGGDPSAKLLHIMEGLTAAFRNLIPSFHPFDLCIGVVAAGIIRLAVYVKGKKIGRAHV